MHSLKHAVVAAATVTAALSFPAPAYGQTNNFQSPSGNIYCTLDNTGAACDISEFTYQPPPPPECAQHIEWGSRFRLSVGKAAIIECHGDTLKVPGEPTLNYGQTVSAGTVTCSSEQSGVRCTDTASGHYFRVSRDSYNLG
ncbi:hypothetical protein MKUB_55320 [Mycobacterium kubicae]|uniref:Ig-like domain-containing protein n=1 Tax=Mycobacterium kubicae TaxID=120959 RepID=A0AAX1J6H5_9MYCO|nr:DUF6636 domain-containing protein [Mycobacterium kubicae]MCV7094146.1 hypothetical protein [Mycobacterium kubicae]OBF21408.1 hypothetical protein A5725_01380 [Mycobacterium kubicae]OBK49814.1 hypothetical protein A5657_21350 [Mycobacterium kubicae]ORV98487.1 hypothetical protein AWC13_13655 [Mycobacterium kubicae]QNI07596.1 hypothetical protein GAN17_15830 [Mycobacterium kubicae]